MNHAERHEIGSAGWCLLSGDHLARYYFAKNYCKKKAVLDCGTGAGYGAAILASRWASEVTAIDIDDKTIENARRQFQSQNLRFQVDNAESLATIPNSSVDVVVSFENIEHLNSPQKFLGSACRVLSSDGILICSTPDRSATAPFKNGKPANPFHVNEWYRSEFMDTLRQNFRYVNACTQVQTYAWTKRRETASNLRLFCHEAEKVLLGLKNSKTRKAVGFIRTLLRLQPSPEVIFPTLELEQLAQGHPCDFPIISDELAYIYGDSLCHVAICSNSPINEVALSNPH